jgi:hypothetical protein
MTRFISGLVVWSTLLWVFDAGAYTILAYIFYIGFVDLDHNIRSYLKKLAGEAATLTLSLITLMLTATVFYFFLYKTMPNWADYAAFIYLPLKSPPYFRLPFPQTVLPWIMIVIPFMALSHILTQKRIGSEPDTSDRVITFLALLAVWNMNYFMFRSHINTVHILAIPVVVIFIRMAKQFLDKFRNRPILLVIAGFSWAFWISLVASFLIPQAIANLKKANIVTTIAAVNTGQGWETERFKPTVNGITEKYSQYLKIRDPAIVSVFDTWYLVLMKRQNETGSFCLACIFNPDQGIPYAEAIRKKQSQYVFADTNRTYYQGQMNWVWDRVKDNYEWVETIGELDVYRLK